MILLPWLLLLFLLAIEVGSALLHIGWLTGILAPTMIAVVVVAFMKIRTESALSRIFAVAGLFWLAIMLGLGSVDFLARRNIAVSPTTTSSIWR